MESNDNRLDLGGVVNPLLPSNPSESYLTAILPPDSYTAIVEGVDGTSGVALVELYDLEPGVSRVANISTRGYIASANDVMIGGYIVGSGDPTKVIVRALGPSLAAFGVIHPLPNPVLSIYDADGTLIASNDDWRSTQAQEIQATIPPTRRSRVGHCCYFGAGGLHSHGGRCYPRDWDWIVRALQPRALKAGCLARTRTLTKRSRISRATITPRGTAEERELSPGHASAQVTTRRAGV